MCHVGEPCFWAQLEPLARRERGRGGRTAMLLCLRADKLAGWEVARHEADVRRGAARVGEDALRCLHAGKARLDRPGPIVGHDGGEVEVL